MSKQFVVTTGEEIISKKHHILENLNKRYKDRQNELDTKLEQRNKEHSNKEEGDDYFAKVFAEKVEEIKSLLSCASTAYNEKSVGDGPSINLISHFDDITRHIQELQNYLTSSTMFLTDFKIKACQNIINRLVCTNEEVRLLLIPKKKFGFSGRKIASQKLLNPKLTIDLADGSETRSQLSFNNVVSWTLSNRSNEYICIKDIDVNNKDITMSNLHNCFIEIQGHAGSLQVSGVSQCVFLTGPIARSLFAENCKQSIFATACQQLRLHSSVKCSIFLHVTCRAIIEDCCEIEIGSYNYDYNGIKDDFKLAALNEETNNYTDIADFNWLSADQPSPNWKLLSDCSPKMNWQQMKQTFLTANNTQNT